jgi:hypothetical protein
LFKGRRGPIYDPKGPKTKNKGYYEVDVTLPAPTKDTDADQSKFAKYCNVRIDQVRVWLFGAVVDVHQD